MTGKEMYEGSRELAVELGAGDYFPPWEELDADDQLTWEELSFEQYEMLQADLGEMLA